MDKPELLKSIINNHPYSSVEFIQLQAEIELDRQSTESIGGMLHKKSYEQLRDIIEWREPITLSFGVHDAIKEGKVEEDNIKEHSNGSKGRKAR